MCATSTASNRQQSEMNRPTITSIKGGALFFLTPIAPAADEVVEIKVEAPAPEPAVEVKKEEPKPAPAKACCAVC